MHILIAASWRILKRPRPVPFSYAFPDETREDRPLAPCPDAPNCVSSLAADPARAVEPIPYAVSRPEAVEALKTAMGSLPRARLTAQKESKLRFECRSRLFGFIDEVDFWLDDATKLVHVRSAARSGWYDFGVNRSRVERLRELLAPLLTPAPDETPDDDAGDPAPRATRDQGGSDGRSSV